MSRIGANFKEINEIILLLLNKPRIYDKKTLKSLSFSLSLSLSLSLSALNNPQRLIYQ